MPDKIKALLLDLDDTLLLNDMTRFGPPYFRALLAKMQGIAPPDLFIQALNEGTEAMYRNDGSQGTNEEVFKATFFARVALAPEQVMPIFEAFYAQDFDMLQQYTAPDPNAHRLMDLAFEGGYQVAIATLPVFPKSATLARLRWAGVGAERYPYALVTTYEHMRACKPHPAFFRQVLESLGRQPYECVMVGDSLESDMPARDLGIKTFWVDQGRSAPPSEPLWDASGSLADLIELIQSGRIDAL
ncbi:MAG: HAD family hydrolase [Anaerolineae bacterium]